jgi:hypothetical protein
MHNLNNKLKPISNSYNLSGEKVAFTAVERIKTAITTAIENSTSKEEAEQIKVAAKLAIKVVQENINNGYRLNMLNHTIMQELEQLEEPANNLFKILTQNNLSDLEKTSTYYNQSFRSPINFGVHEETNYTSVNNSLIEFIDQIQRRVDFFALLSDEVSLDILSRITKPKDQQNLRLVCRKANQLVIDRGNLADPFLSIRVNYDAWVEENELESFLKLLIALNRTTSLNLSKDNSTGNFSRYLYSIVPFTSALPSAFKRFPYIKLFKALINLDTLISLNITGCDLNDEELELIGRIPKLKEVIMTEGMNNNTKIKILLANDYNDQPKLYLALEKGNIGLVVALTKAILSSELPQEEKSKLLAVKGYVNRPGLFVAMFNPEEENPLKLPGLCTAMYNGHAEVITRFATLILNSNLSDKEKFKLLAAKDDIFGISGLHLALEKGHAKVVSAFTTAVFNAGIPIPDQVKLELLGAKRVDGVPGLHLALQNGHAEAVAAFTIAVLNSELSNPEKIELLAAKTADGVPGLCRALTNGHAEAVALFTKLVLSSDIPNPEKIELLAAKTADGFPGLFIALEKGHAEAVALFTKVVSSSNIANQEKLELLAAKIADGTSGLYMALRYGGRKVALTLIMQLVQLEINLLTLNEWMILDTSEVGCKLHGLLMAITRDNKFLRDLNDILLGSQPNELYQEIIKTYEPIIAQRYPLGEKYLYFNFLGYCSSEEFWNKMSEALKLVKRLHNGCEPEPATFLERAQSLYKSFI